MKIVSVIHVLGLLLLFLALALLVPVPVALLYHETDWSAFLMAAAITAASGIIAFKTTNLNQELRAREGFAIVTLGWLTFSLLGALPFVLSGQIPSFTDAFFETISGFTTTGATILTEIESLSHAALFWRSFTHWLGGMGIIVLSLAILPFLGVGGMQLFKAEVPGPVPDKLTPRVTETAKILWGVYVAISAVEVVLLMLGGMNLFDALCHTFGTMATGGFSTKNASIGYYDNAYIQYVIIFFMILAGTNFSLHFQFWKRGPKVYWQNRELRFFLLIIGIISSIVTVELFFTGEGALHGLERNFRDALFQVVSIITTTGYGTADYEKWSQASQFLLFLLMFIGGCAGSTGGGMKVIRFYILIKFVRTEIKQLLHPKAIIPIRIGDTVIHRDIAKNIVGFFILMISLFIFGVIILTTLGADMVTAFGATAATLGNIGPGLGEVGPTDHYAYFHTGSKWVLSFLMLAGRLEIYTVLILLAPSFWKK
ncbi:MAG: TrkH family potassium uptake protein [Calditrichia bacterium]